MTTSAEETQPAHVRNSRHAFSSTRRLYGLIARRATRIGERKPGERKSDEQKLFLLRHLRKVYKLNKEEKEKLPKVAPLRSVVYTSNEPGIDWSKRINDPCCLWCPASFFRFEHPAKLLLHLRTCHDMLEYSIPHQNQSPLVVNVKLRRNTDPSENIGALHNAKRESTEDPSAQPLSQRLRKRTRNEESPPPNDSLSGDDAEYSTTRRKPKAKTRRKAGKPRPRAKPAFKSIDEAAESGRLYHSVVNNPFDMEQFEFDGEESDNDSELEKKWRFDLSCEAMCDVADTIPIEKMFMMLWNQFVQLEHKIDADRDYSAACVQFVKTHGITLRQMRLEATFVRHLNQLVRIGLLDADNVHQLLGLLPVRSEVMRACNGDEKRTGRNMPSFRFAEYVVRKSELRTQRQDRLQDMMEKEGDKTSTR